MAYSPSLSQRATRVGMLRGLYKIQGPPTNGIRDWIAGGNYSVLKAPAAARYEVFVPSAGPLLQSLAYDINRMSCGSFETVLSISPVDLMRKSLAWFSIQLYYAAFFAAHAFLRMQGISCTQLDIREATRLSSVFQAYGYPPGSKISSGFRIIDFNEATKILGFKVAASGGGSHEAVWEEYKAGLERLKVSVSSSSLLAAEVSLVTKKLALVQSAISQNNSKNGNWLSKVRNEINYRHSLGVWWPHPTSNNIDKYMGMVRAHLSQDPLDNDLEMDASLESFVQVCLFIINLTRSSVIDMSKLDLEGNSFQEHGPMTMLKRGRLAK